MTGLPRTFKRWISDQAAPSFREAAKLRTVPLQPPKADEVLVKTIYATVNGGHDTFVSRREGFWSGKGECNLGADGLGQVVDVGSSVSKVKIGDYVCCGLCSSFSEYTTPKESFCFVVDKPDPHYAALTVAGTYSILLLETVLRAESGKTLLVPAACGGVGHIAVQIGKMNGCRVIGVCGGEVKAAKLRELGIDRVVDYKKEDLREVLRDEYPGGLDYVIDGVGGDMFKIAYDNLADGGLLMVAGYMSMYPHTYGYKSERPESDFGIEGLPSIENLFWKGKEVVLDGKTIRGSSSLNLDREVRVRSMAEALSRYREGKLKVIVDQYMLDNFVGVESAVEATEYMLAGKNVGKALIKVASP